MAHIGNFKTKKQLKQMILEMLKIIPIIETRQAARLLQGHRESPQKRASEMLLELERNEHLIESRHRRIEETKVYRLSQAGRKLMGITKQPIRLNTSNLDHYLAIGDFYLWLKQNGELYTFETELRETFKIGLQEKKYCPDAFFIWNKKVYLLEIQLTPTSKKRWEAKHVIRNSYFDPIRNFFHQASFQKYAQTERKIKPRMVILSRSKEDNVASGSTEKLIIIKTHDELPNALERYEKAK